MLIDSHVNLHSEKFCDDLDEVIAAARTSGIKGMLTISDRLTSTAAIQEISEKYDFVWRSVGVHPHYANEYEDLTTEKIVELAKSEDVIGIGE